MTDHFVEMAELLRDAAKAMNSAAAEIENAKAAQIKSEALHRMQQQNTIAFAAENERLRKCLGFFASVIKSGEAWSETCEREYQEAKRRE